MSVISSAVFPEHLLTQLQQSADAVVRRLKSFIYLHRNSSWYVNGSGNYAVRAHISSVKDQGVNVFLTVRTGCHRAEYVFHRLPVSFPEGILMTEALHDVTFRILSMFETRRDVCPAQYGLVSGVFIRGEILRDNVSCGEQVFVAPLGDCDPADPELCVWCQYYGYSSRV